MGVDMDKFGGQQGNAHDPKAESTANSPGVIEIGSGMTGHELGALEDGSSEVGEFHDGTQGRDEDRMIQ